MSEDESEKKRVTYTVSQRRKLEEVFAKQDTIDLSLAQTLANQLSVSVRQIRTWFQNKRAKRRRDEYKKGRKYPFKFGSPAVSHTEDTSICKIVPQWTSTSSPSVSVTVDSPVESWRSSPIIEPRGANAISYQLPQANDLSRQHLSLSYNDLSSNFLLPPCPNLNDSSVSSSSWHSEQSCDYLSLDGATSGATFSSLDESIGRMCKASSIPALHTPVYDFNKQIWQSLPDLPSGNGYVDGLDGKLPSLSVEDLLSLESFGTEPTRRSSTSSLTSFLAELQTESDVEKESAMEQIISYLRS